MLKYIFLGGREDIELIEFFTSAISFYPDNAHSHVK